MIKLKDASSVERRVKNTSNLLTQKRKGETHTMGNRGMTNWKLGAFFIISLMLCAGLFGNTAMAANGGGTVTVGWDGSAATAPAAVPSAIGVADSETANTPPLNAGTRYNAIQITYTATAADKMGGGLVRIDLPGLTIAKIATDDTTTTMVTETGYYRNVLITSDADAPAVGTDPRCGDVIFNNQHGSIRYYWCECVKRGPRGRVGKGDNLHRGQGGGHARQRLEQRWNVDNHPRQCNDRYP